MRALLLCLCGAMFPGTALAQGTLSLSSVSVNPGLLTSLNLYLTVPTGIDMAAVQWTMSYPADEVASVAVSAGPAAQAVQKTPTCSGATGSYTCIVSGLNVARMQSGVVAVVWVTPGQFARGAIRIEVTGALATSRDGTPILLTGGGGVISIVEAVEISVTNVTSDAIPFAGPRGVAVDASGNLFVADTLNNRILMITPAGHASVVAGVGTSGWSGDGAPATNAQLNQPAAVATDLAGNIYVADSQNHRIRAFRVAGNITTVAGNGSAGFNQDNIPAPNAELAVPSDVAVDSQGNLYIADTGNHRIRMVSAVNHTITTVAGNGSANFSGDAGPAGGASLSFPSGIALDALGNVYVSDSGNNRVREFTPGGNIVTVAGGGCCGQLGDGGPATAAQLNNPAGLAVDSVGNVYIADSNDNRIRMMSAQDGTLLTMAGTGAAGSGPGQLSGPLGVTFDQRGQLYIADTNNNRIQAITLSQGLVSVGSGSGAPGNTVQIPLTLNLNPLVSIDTLGVTLQLSPTGATPITFTAASGISHPDISRSTADHIVLAWNHDLSVAAQPALSGTVLLGTIGVSIPVNAPIGSSIQISVSQASGDLTQGNSQPLRTVPLLADLAGSLSVTNCIYLVGDISPLADPASNNRCGTFGDNQLTFEDVILALRMWAFPPPQCTDLADALDADPTDGPSANPPVLGGDGLPMDLQDLQVIVQRWANLDPSRPTRPAGSYARFSSCSLSGASGPPHHLSRRISQQKSPVNRPVGGRVELGAAEILGATMRVPVYLHASQPLQGLAITAGWYGSTQVALRFTNGQLPKPNLLDTETPGIVTAAWLQSLPPARGERILVGYIEWERTRGIPSGTLRVYRTEAISSSQTALTLEFDDPSRE